MINTIKKTELVRLESLEDWEDFADGLDIEVKEGEFEFDTDIEDDYYVTSDGGMDNAGCYVRVIVNADFIEKQWMIEIPRTEKTVNEIDSVENFLWETEYSAYDDDSCESILFNVSEETEVITDNKAVLRFILKIKIDTV